MLDICDAVNDPGTPGLTGDDRYGSNPAAGCAWVIDGATDVTPLNPFPGTESGAAWLADCLSGLLQAPPGAGEPLQDYFVRQLMSVQDEARRQSSVPLADLPMEAQPIATMMWVRVSGNTCEFAWAGDCFALAGQGSADPLLLGTEEAADHETRSAARMQAWTAQDRMAWLQAQRRAAQTPLRGLVSIEPLAALSFSYRKVTLPPGAHVLLMTDGLFRFVVPYGLGAARDLFSKAVNTGLPRIVEALRAHESVPHGLRIKVRDDAAGLLLRLPG